MGNKERFIMLVNLFLFIVIVYVVIVTNNKGIEHYNNLCQEQGLVSFETYIQGDPYCIDEDGKLTKLFVLTGEKND